MNHAILIRFLVLALPLACSVRLAAQAPPASFTRSISTGSQSVTVDFQHHSIRNANFEVFVQQADGSFATHTPEPSRTYIGTVQGHPGAIACGLLRADDTLWSSISFEDGTTWTGTGGPATEDGSSFIPQWPTSEVGGGGAGSAVFAVELGLDLTHNHYTACGGTPDLAVAKSEFSVLSTNIIYLRDAAITHRIGRIVIRADAARDPYATDGGDTGLLLNRVKSLWNAGSPMGTTHQIAAVIHSAANGGLAWVGAVGTSNRYSANDSDEWGNFTGVWRHEAGHNWGSSHYEGGGNPEGSTIMSNNSLSRFSSSELARIISHRNSRTGLANLGPFPLPLPPRANQLRASFYRNTPLRVDPLQNDSDSNGHALSLHSFDAASALGGTLTRSSGTGPGGRDEILYTPPATLRSGTDWFRYRIQDSSGMQAVGFVMLRPRPEALTLADRWTLDESTGTAAANLVRSSHNGSHENGALAGQAGAAPGTLRGTYYDGSNDRTLVPAPNYNTNTLTFTCWVRRSGTQNQNAGIVFSRSGSTSGRGLQFGSGNQLAYNWGNSVWNSGLIPPDDTWCLVSLVITPEAATIHLRTPVGLQTAGRSATHSSNSFSSPLHLGWDSGGSSRHFRGWLDDVRVWTSALTAADVESLYQQAITPPALALASPAAGASVSPLEALFAASVSSQEWAVDGIDFLGNGTEVATTSAFPWQAVATNLTPGAMTALARASYGDWAYQVESPPQSVTILPAPVPVVSVTASMPASWRGPVPGTFTFTRSHGIGPLTVPFGMSGTAVPGTDYTALPSSVGFSDGQRVATLTLDPLLPAGSPSKTAILTLQSGTGHEVGTPPSATLAIDDHITSVADGAWNAGTSWNSGNPAPTSGTQNSGTGYSVAHAVTSNNTNSNSQALVAGYLRVKSGGILDLARLHDGTLVNASYNLPATTVDGGGILRFRCSNGSSAHTVAANLAFSGSSTILISGGNYENKAVLGGVVSGGGRIELVSETSSYITSDLRQLSLTRANNPYAGDWSVSHTPSGDDFAVLRAAAANSLGTGTVTLGRRARLVNDNATGLDSLAGVILNGDNSLLALNQPWNQPAATLALTGGAPAVQLGNSTSRIGSLSGITGSITGSGSSSNLVVNQTAPAQFGGTLGPNLTFTKSGPEFLGLTQVPDPGLRLAVQQGTLALPGGPVTVASLTQSGGILRARLPAAGEAALTVSGNLTRSGGVMEFILPESPPALGVPFTLAAYQGTLGGQPQISFSRPVLAMIDYGSGSNSAITATFYELYNLTVASSDPERGEVSGGGPHPSNTRAAITATAAPGWRFVNWSGTGIENPASPSTTVFMDAAKTVTAHFDRPRSVWTQPASGGSWSAAANWDLAPVFIADEWLDFSTLDLGAANTSLMDGSRTVGGLRFADLPTASHDWTLAPGSGGILTLATTTGLPPEIEVLNRSAILTASLAGNQGLTTSGAGTLVLNHPSNTIRGPLTVAAGILQVRDGSTNSPAVFDSTTQRTLTVNTGATLDLPRLHSFTVQTVSWALPAITLNEGSTLRFRAQVGSNAHQLAAPIAVAGTVTVNNNGGAYAQDISLTGPLSGSGTIQYLATSGSSAATTNRTLTITNPGNTFNGNWFVDYTGSTSDDFAVLRPTAADALGTGTVTLDDRSRLVAGSAAALDSVTGVILLKATSTLDLQSRAWSQPAATLDLRNGTVETGGATMNLGSLVQTGGSLRLLAGAQPPLFVAGNAVFSGGNIELTVTGDPAGSTFEVLRYGGSLTGTPAITIVGAERLTPVIDFGSGADDVVTVTFPPGADLVWHGSEPANPGVWDLGRTENWSRGATTDRFLQNDRVRFDDSALNTSPVLTETVAPSSVTFDHSVHDLVLGGPGSITGPVTILKSGAARLTLASPHTHAGGTLVTLGEVTAGHPGAFGSGPVTLRHGASSTIPTRVNLANVTIANDFILDSNAATGGRGAIHAAPGNLLSVLGGTLTVQSPVGDGGHVSSAGGGILRLTGTLNSTGPVPVLHGGTFEMATTGGNLAELTLGEGLIRLAAANGIQPSLRLNLAASGSGTLDLHGHAQTLAELRQASTHPAHVTNSATTPAVLIIDGTVDHAFGGTIGDGGGPLGIVKRGSSRLTLSGANSHTGDTLIEGGTLSLATASLADGSMVAISTGAVLDLPHGQEDTVAALVVGDVAQAPGEYDASRSPFITGTGSLVVTSGPVTDPYATWAASEGLDGSPGRSAGFDDDPDRDGFASGLEWILGGDPLDGTGGGLVSHQEDGGLVLSFNRNPSAVGQATLTVEYSGSLAGPWHSVIIGTADSGPDGRGVTVGIDAEAAPHDVTVSIPALNAVGGRLFGRLRAVRP